MWRRQHWTCLTDARPIPVSATGCTSVWASYAAASIRIPPQTAADGRLLLEVPQSERDRPRQEPSLWPGRIARCTKRTWAAPRTMERHHASTEDQGCHPRRRLWWNRHSILAVIHTVLARPVRHHGLHSRVAAWREGCERSRRRDTRSHRRTRPSYVDGVLRKRIPHDSTVLQRVAATVRLRS